MLIYQEPSEIKFNANGDIIVSPCIANNPYHKDDKCPQYKDYDSKLKSVGL